MLDTFNGKRLHELELEDVRTLLDDARAEPLDWEAKGVEVTGGAVRKQTCGFANSHDGGYLILGTDIRGDEWVLDGVTFPDDDPPAWVSSVALGVQPYPEGLDTRAIPTSEGRMLAVVWVPPTPTPPCNAHGTVYERVSGRTVSVREPLRLAQLFARGDGAHQRAQAHARRAAKRTLQRLDAQHSPALQFSLGLCATGYAPDIGSRLFSERFWNRVAAAIPGALCEHRQNGLAATSIPAWDGDIRWRVLATWDGSVGVGCDPADERYSVASICHPILDAWNAALPLIAEMEPVGPVYLALALRGEPFPFNEVIRLDRGPIRREVDEGLLRGMQRELSRAAGRREFEKPDE